MVEEKAQEEQQEEEQQEEEQVAEVFQLNHMKMWSTSNNPIVKPPKIIKLPGRPSKVRRK